MISEERIKEKVKELAKKIEKDYEGKRPYLIGVLKGAFIFLADLVREINIPVQIDFIAVSSYGKSAQSSGKIKIVKDLSEDIKGKDVILVEDIVDTGLTLKYLYELLLERKPKSLKLCVLFDKKERRKIELSIDYVGFIVPNEFLVGYGLDFAEKFRHLKYVKSIIPEEVEENEKGR